MALRGDEGLDEEGLDDVLHTVRAKFQGSIDSMEIEIEKHFPSQLKNAYEVKEERDVRADALEYMTERYSSLISSWKQAPYAMEDKRMAEHFVTDTSASQAHLTTYFGSGFKGLVNERLVRQISEEAILSIKKHGWKKFLEKMQGRIAGALDPLCSPIRHPRFAASNISFHENCAEAFQKFMLATMRSGDRVLATSEEYMPMVKDLLDHGVTVKQMERPNDQEAFLRDVARELSPPGYDYILVSEVGRLGTVYPLEAIHQLRQGSTSRPKLIVDAAQSAGRRQHDMYSCQADVVVLSTSKGADMGPGMGVLAVTDELSSPAFNSNGGTRHLIQHAAYAMNPNGLLTPESSPQILTPYQRERSTAHLAGKFLELRDAINAKYGSTVVELLNPLNPKQLAHAVEIKIKGVKREYFVQIAEGHGVYVDSDYGVKDDESIRIAFHPYMNNEALLILGGVIEHCIDHPKQSPILS
jgi:selenocysteine lyase/cysteine desulfurase